MNYYQKNIGDYAAATAHLTDLEDLFYRRMLDRYYMTEAPLTSELDELCRHLRARDKQQRSAVQTVLNEFFSHEEGVGWRQDRCDEEIAAYREKAERARNNGKRGGRPAQFRHDVPRGTKPNASTNQNPEETQSDIYGLSECCEDETHQQANHEPLTTNQDSPPTPRKRGNGFDALAIVLPGWLPFADWSVWVQHRKEIRHPLTPTSCERQLADLETWRAAGHDPVSIITTSVRAGWQGLFAPKGGTAHQPRMSLSERSAMDELAVRNLHGS